MLFSSQFTHVSPILFLPHDERPLTHRAEGRPLAHFYPVCSRIGFNGSVVHFGPSQTPACRCRAPSRRCQTPSRSAVVQVAIGWERCRCQTLSNSFVSPSGRVQLLLGFLLVFVRVAVGVAVRFDRVQVDGKTQYRGTTSELLEFCMESTHAHTHVGTRPTKNRLSPPGMCKWRVRPPGMCKWRVSTPGTCMRRVSTPGTGMRRVSPPGMGMRIWLSDPLEKTADLDCTTILGRWAF